MANTKLLGSWGEAVAVEYLRKKRYQILACGYRTRYGEIDIIAQKKHCLVFVEVKLRKNASVAKAMEYVDGRKRERLRKTASIFLSENLLEMPARFDVIEIYAPEGTATARPVINHLEDAFQ